MSLSSITVTGTLKKDPEKRYTPTNIPVTNLMVEICFIPRGSLAQQENFSSQVVRVSAWRDLAEECERKLKTGDKILIMGRAQINAYTNNEGKKKREVEIDATFITLLNDVLSIQPPKAKEKLEKVAAPASTFDEVVNNTEEIPF